MSGHCWKESRKVGEELTFKLDCGRGELTKQDRNAPGMCGKAGVSMTRGLGGARTGLQL